ncbi:MAG: hypothetical protein KC994_06280, partial [Candidatus Omnitrophica bacterium]|nr:hypothetical protein [Candidatus Omnitrophota bacterium]
MLYTFWLPGVYQRGKRIKSFPFISILVVIQVFLGTAFPKPAFAVDEEAIVSSIEIWDGTANPHAAQGVTLSGSGTWQSPYVYTIPEGLTVTDRGVIRFASTANFKLVFVNKGLNIEGDGLMDLNKGGDRLSIHLCTWDMGGHDITGTGRVDSSATGAQGLEIVNVKNVDLRIINLQRSDTAPAPVSITATGRVTIPQGINTSDSSPGGNAGGSVNIRASQIEIGYIRTGSMRTATPTTNGNVQLLALAPPDYNVGNRYGNMISNSLVLKGEIDTHGGHPETTGGDVILAGVQLALETNFAFTTPQEVLVSVNAG